MHNLVLLTGHVLVLIKNPGTSYVFCLLIYFFGCRCSNVLTSFFKLVSGATIITRFELATQEKFSWLSMNIHGLIFAVCLMAWVIKCCWSCLMWLLLCLCLMMFWHCHIDLLKLPLLLFVNLMMFLTLSKCCLCGAVLVYSMQWSKK